MFQLFSTFSQLLRRSLILLGLVGLLSFSLGAGVPALAAMGDSSPRPGQMQPEFDHANNPAQREASYEKLSEVAKSPENIEEEYEKNLQAFESAHPESLIDKAKDVIEDVTGQK